MNVSVLYSVPLVDRSQVETEEINIYSFITPLNY